MEVGERLGPTCLNFGNSIKVRNEERGKSAPRRYVGACPGRSPWRRTLRLDHPGRHVMQGVAPEGDSVNAGTAQGVESPRGIRRATTPIGLG